MRQLEVKTVDRRQVIDLTDQVAEGLPAGEGLLNIFVQHTTAAVTIMDLDPGTDEDLLDFLDGLTPRLEWRHAHDPTHAPDHLLSSLIGVSLNVPYKDGRLELGNWQRIVLVELDGPNERTIIIT